MQPTTGEDFSNINVRPGTGGPNQPGVVYSTPASASGRIQFNRNCLLFASIRFLLIVILKYLIKVVMVIIILLIRNCISLNLI